MDLKTSTIHAKNAQSPKGLFSKPKTEVKTHGIVWPTRCGKSTTTDKILPPVVSRKDLAEQLKKTAKEGRKNAKSKGNKSTKPSLIEQEANEKFAEIERISKEFVETKENEMSYKCSAK
jgi:hypothetical protein